MVKRNRNVKSEIIQKRIERHGQGEFSEYKPWLPMGIKASLWRVTRVLGSFDTSAQPDETSNKGQEPQITG